MMFSRALAVRVGKRRNVAIASANTAAMTTNVFGCGCDSELLDKRLLRWEFTISHCALRRRDYIAGTIAIEVARVMV